ncbi:uncharacterized protein I303_103900 [Kwoniella dejecticola CBS 10117]|uniref:Uncharacterized protein n=1 Tax=Kwoniella dejecticola CBS 10117 TaxID=1296121 RepID=A0A1A6A817_9TREE|nr:uncharacterized protein I303_03919 [Kwoniella dejecticola CBS 10117]OBR86199.1 hypothetical protein I303_03919 [Kwoniella dejecticola CBS 10117]
MKSVILLVPLFMISEIFAAPHFRYKLAVNGEEVAIPTHISQEDILQLAHSYLDSTDVHDVQLLEDPVEEKHQVTQKVPQGNGTYKGIIAGNAYLQDFESANCQHDGYGCGSVQFTLSNGGGHGELNKAAYDLRDSPRFGSHKYTYDMYFYFTGDYCNNHADGPCTGPQPKNCPGAYFGDGYDHGSPTECFGVDTGIVIKFC